MKATSLLFIAAIFCIATQASPTPHNDHDHDHHRPTITTSTPNLITPDVSPATVNPSITPSIQHSHNQGHGAGMDMDMDNDVQAGRKNHTVVNGPVPPEEMSYWLWPEHKALLYAHSIVMVLAWGFVLPVGSKHFPQSANCKVLCSELRSRLSTFLFKSPSSHSLPSVSSSQSCITPVPRTFTRITPTIKLAGL